jgi:hypothetical protein
VLPFSYRHTPRLSLIFIKDSVYDFIPIVWHFLGRKKSKSIEMADRPSAALPTSDDSIRKVRQLRQKTQQLLRHLHYQQRHPDPLIKAVREAVDRSEEDFLSPEQHQSELGRDQSSTIYTKYSSRHPPPAPRRPDTQLTSSATGRARQQTTKSLLEGQFEFRNRMQRSISPLRILQTSNTADPVHLRYGFHSSLQASVNI